MSDSVKYVLILVAIQMLGYKDVGMNDTDENEYTNTT